MGNWFGRRQVVHPLDQDGDQDVKRSRINQSSSSLKIKVLMTRNQLKELMAQVALREGNSELGRIILQECLEGRLRARVVAGRGLASEYDAWALSTIKEE